MDGRDGPAAKILFLPRCFSYYLSLSLSTTFTRISSREVTRSLSSLSLPDQVDCLIASSPVDRRRSLLPTPIHVPYRQASTIISFRVAPVADSDSHSPPPSWPARPSAYR